MKKANSEIRQTKSYGRGSQHNIYLYLHEEDKVPSRLTNCESWIRLTVYTSATRKTRLLKEAGERLAAEYNVGKITWTEAKSQFESICNSLK